MSNIQEAKIRKIYTFNEVQESIKDKGFTIVKDTFINFSKKFLVVDDLGYYFYMSADNIRRNRNPKIFEVRNPFTIQNIRNYLKINNIKTKLLSNQYFGNNELMLWQCECGECFEKTWNDFQRSLKVCKKCSLHIQGLQRRIEVNEINSLIKEKGYTLIDDISNMAITIGHFNVYDVDGYKYSVTWSGLKNGKTPERFHPCNPHTIYNINIFLENELNGEYERVDEHYVNNTTKLKFIHKICGTEFYNTWADMFDLKINPAAYCKCPKCNTYKVESHHASALKQIFLHEYDDTICEEKSCINPITLRAMPTDIVNHRLKIAIEIQSQWHDSQDRVIKDSFKRDFWINKGYDFYAPDIRDYSILEMIQLFFPNIDKIPDYVDYNFSNCVDFVQVQNLLNDGFTIKEIALILNCPEGTVRHLSTIKKVKLPDDYRERVLGQRAFVQLTKSGEFICKYDSLNSLSKYNFASGTIRRVLKGQQDFAYDCFWVYELDYISGNYKLPEIKQDKFDVSVAKYDMSDNYIQTYDTIYEAENDSISSKSEIYRVAKGDRKSSRNEKWKFLN